MSTHPQAVTHQVDWACNAEEWRRLLVGEVVERAVVEHNGVEERAAGVLEVISCKKCKDRNRDGSLSAIHHGILSVSLR